VTFTATLSPSRRITLDLPPGVAIPSQLLHVVGAMGGDNPIAFADCPPADQVEAMAQRLAALLLGGA
jgi:hypothetical protein